jgi:hypothetical protein
MIRLGIEKIFEAMFEVLTLDELRMIRDVAHDRVTALELAEDVQESSLPDGSHRVPIDIVRKLSGKKFGGKVVDFDSMPICLTCNGNKVIQGEDDVEPCPQCGGCGKRIVEGCWEYNPVECVFVFFRGDDSLAWVWMEGDEIYWCTEGYDLDTLAPTIGDAKQRAMVKLHLKEREDAVASTDS